ncbi:MAG TPA: hypothetical protein VJR89_43675 [Polyangiales bacterium]|nr:hypothetical protein [Polyangiales bacterium]
MRPREFLAALEDPTLPPCSVAGEQAESLRVLLVHLFFADLDLDKRELQLLTRVLPEENVRDYLKAHAARKLDLDRLAELFPDAADRADIVRLAEHAVWGDERLAHREQDLLDRLVRTLGVHS